MTCIDTWILPFLLSFLILYILIDLIGWVRCIASGAAATALQKTHRDVLVWIPSWIPSWIAF